jgi:hypothetical protein
MTPEDALERYIADYQVDGIAYTRHDDGLYWTDDDNALYTGVMLGAMVYRYAADPSEDKLEAVRMCLRGTWLLITASGHSGILVRRAMPTHLMGKFGGDAYGVDKPMGQHAGYTYQLKTTRDQITGVLFGLACARSILWGVDRQIDDSVTQQINMLYYATVARSWTVRDYYNDSHGTSASKLDAPLRLLLKALYASVNKTSTHLPREGFFDWIRLVTIHYNTTIQNAYSHGLNAMAAHALWLMSGHHAHHREVKQWMSIIESVVRDEHNPFWEVLLDFRLCPIAEGRLDEAGEEPYTKFFKWNRYKKELTSRLHTSGPMIDYMVVSYMRDYWS